MTRSESYEERGAYTIYRHPDPPELWVIYQGTRRVSQHETHEGAMQHLGQLTDAGYAPRQHSVECDLDENCDCQDWDYDFPKEYP